jgi:hypothetical protein
MTITLTMKIPMPHNLRCDAVVEVKVRMHNFKFITMIAVSYIAAALQIQVKSVAYGNPTGSVCG